MKSRICLIFVLLAQFVSLWNLRASDETKWLGLLPQPRNITLLEGEFCFSPATQIVCPEYMSGYVAEYFRSGGRLSPAIIMRENSDLELPAEGYVLSVATEGILIEGVDRAGVLNGFHTMLQLFPDEIYSCDFDGTAQLPAMRIEDWPEYSYRGMHFDVARTFSPVGELKEFINHLARHKINHLHLHLTDDEGWRFEVLSHPRLTEVGAWRGGDSPIRAIYGAWDERYGGYYTQNELREVVAYAEQRGVSIIPEIDLPGHSLAMGKVYPEVLCPVERDNSAAAGYDRRNVLCVAREENYALLDDILRELCDVFPSEYIHVGGDEVATSYWRDCPHCRELMKEMGMRDYAELQQLFMERVSDILAKYGRKAAMWNEATNGGTLPRDVRIYGWEGIEECRSVAEAGYPTVVMPGPYFYFDMRQSPHEDGHNWAGVVTVEKCYSAANLDALGYSQKAKNHVVGFSGAFWSELYITHGDKYENYAEYQTFPRVCALAEICWLPVSMCHTEQFLERLGLHMARMDAMGISYRRAAPALPTKGITPKLTITTSLPVKQQSALDRLSAYANDFGVRAQRTCLEGDWILYTFDSPIKQVEVELTTGYRHVARGVFPVAKVEVSSDGKHYKEIAHLKNGCAKIALREPTVAIRITSLAEGNSDAYVYMQYPQIVPM